eukprot:403361710
MIPDAYAVVYPGTVMIESLYTPVASYTVFRSQSTNQLAIRAKLGRVKSYQEICERNLRGLQVSWVMFATQSEQKHCQKQQKQTWQVQVERISQKYYQSCEMKLLGKMNRMVSKKVQTCKNKQKNRVQLFVFTGPTGVDNIRNPNLFLPTYNQDVKWKFLVPTFE